MAHKLTKAYIDSLPFTTEKGKQAFYYDSELKGFGLRVGNTTKAYIAETKVLRKTVRVTLGKHGVLAPEQARKLAKEKLAAMAQDINPNKVDREKRIKSITLEEAYRDYMEARKSLKATTKRDYKKCAEGYLKEWLKKPLCEITRDMVEQKHRNLSETSEARANLAMRFLRALFNFSAEYRDSEGRVIIGDNPVRRLSARNVSGDLRQKFRRDRKRFIKPQWPPVAQQKLKLFLVD